MAVVLKVRCAVIALVLAIGFGACQVPPTFDLIIRGGSVFDGTGVLARGSPHPRAYGTFPRVLGKYVRDEKVLELPEALRRMTSLAASRFGIKDRGIVRPNMYADLVVFDPNTVRENATFDKPHQYPGGIAHVVVNGVPVLDPNGLTGSRPGRPVYGPGRTAAPPS
jgi:N-acyl-D-amino-acid deacylase